jgi:hypothetical protein
MQKNLPRQYMADGKSNAYKIIGGGGTNTIVSRKSTHQYDGLSSDSSSSSDSSDFNQRQYFNINDEKVLRP